MVVGLLIIGLPAVGYTADNDFLIGWSLYNYHPNVRALDGSRVTQNINGLRVEATFVNWFIGSATFSGPDLIVQSAYGATPNRLSTSPLILLCGGLRPQILQKGDYRVHLRFLGGASRARVKAQTVFDCKGGGSSGDADWDSLMRTEPLAGFQRLDKQIPVSTPTGTCGSGKKAVWEGGGDFEFSIKGVKVRTSLSLISTPFGAGAERQIGPEFGAGVVLFKF